MESQRDIKRRMRSISNTQQITRAMEAVSATKMRRSQEYALNARPYAEHALRLLSNVSERISENRHPLLYRQTHKHKLCLIVITSDKGLCGGYNNNLLKIAHSYLQKNLHNEIDPIRNNPDGHRDAALNKERISNGADIITVGKKAKQYFTFRNIPVSDIFTGFGDYIKLDQTLPFVEKIINVYKNGQYKKIMCAYTNFISTLKQEPVIHQVLPITKTGIEKIVKDIAPQTGKYTEKKEQTEQVQHPYNYEYLFEPSQEIVLDELLPLLVKIQIHHMILEANASEHSARMVAMKNASDNASEILTELTLFYNKARQSAITNEILEVIASQESLK